MKKRINDLENSIPEADPVSQLSEIYKEFSQAYFLDKDIEQALAIRESAEPILEAHPELRESVPGRIGKHAFIEWDRFISFPKTKNIN